MRYSYAICAAAMVVVGATRSIQAGIISEGSGATLRYGYGTTAGGIDANTTHLWHFDGSATPFADSTTVIGTAIPLNNIVATTQQNSVLFSSGGAANSARRMNTVTTGTGVIRAFANVGTADDNLSANQYNSYFGSDGSFTVDFLVRPDFGPTGATFPSGGMRIVSGEGNDGTEPNPFSIIWTAANKLEFSASPFSLLADIPLGLASNAFTASGQWFHVGLSYNGDAGTADNTKFYWTLVDGPDTALALATTTANLAGTYTVSDDPSLLASDPGPELSFGNRPIGSRAFVGALDEFRISNVARGAGEFIFVPEPGAMVLVAWMAALCSMGARRQRGEVAGQDRSKL